MNSKTTLIALAAAGGALAAPCAQGAVLPALPEAAYADTELLVVSC